LQDAGDEIDECALAGPVLADQSVDLPAAQVEVDIVQGDHARKRSSNPPQL
jgi:hypothetical protein